MKFAFVASLLFALGCTDHDVAGETLRSAGYSDIELKGYWFFSCGEDDAFSTRFSAVNPQGKRVSGVVCNGYFKGGTIRF